jgi:hypothetical protein
LQGRGALVFAVVSEPGVEFCILSGCRAVLEDCMGASCAYVLLTDRLLACAVIAAQHASTEPVKFQTSNSMIMHCVCTS